MNIYLYIYIFLKVIFYKITTNWRFLSMLSVTYTESTSSRVWNNNSLKYLVPSGWLR